MTDAVKTPSHYTSHPSGIECIEITKHMGFNLGNALKYVWRCDLKKDAIEDLEKAKQYLDFEIAMRKEAKRKEAEDTNMRALQDQINLYAARVAGSHTLPQMFMAGTPGSKWRGQRKPNPHPYNYYYR